MKNELRQPDDQIQQRIDELEGQAQQAEELAKRGSWESFQQEITTGDIGSTRRELQREATSARAKVQILRDYQEAQRNVAEVEKKVGSPDWEVDTEQLTKVKESLVEQEPVIKALASKELSPFVNVTKDGKYSIDLDAASKAGVSKDILVQVGISRGSIALAERRIAREKTARGERGESVRALRQLAEYETDSGYDVARALANGISDSTLLKAGFEQGQINKSRDYAAYLKKTPEGQFNVLVARGEIPTVAKFDGVDSQGNILYTLPAKTPISIYTMRGWDIPKKGTIINGIEVVVPEDARAKVDPTMYYSDTMTRMTPITEDELKSWRTLITVQEIGLSLVPVLGTAYFWDRMGTGQRALSIVGDILIVTPIPWGKIFAPVKQFIKGGKVASMVDDAIKFSTRIGEAELGKISPQLVKPFKQLVNAQSKYGQELVTVAKLEQRLTSTALGEVRTEVMRGLEIAKIRLSKSEALFLQKANSYATKASGLAEDAIVRNEIMRLPNNLMRTTKEVVGNLINPRNAKLIAQDLSTAESNLQKLILNPRTKPASIYDAAIDVVKYRRELIIAKSDGLANVHNQLITLRELVPKLESELRLAKAASSPYTGLIDDSLKLANKQKELLPKYIQDALYYMEVEVGDLTTKITKSTLGDIERLLAKINKINKKYPNIANYEGIPLEQIKNLKGYKTLVQLREAQLELRNLLGMGKEVPALKPSSPKTFKPIGIDDIERSIAANKQVIDIAEDMLKRGKSSKTAEKLQRQIEETRKLVEKQVAERAKVTIPLRKTISFEESSKYVPAKMAGKPTMAIEIARESAIKGGGKVAPIPALEVVTTSGKTKTIPVTEFSIKPRTEIAREYKVIPREITKAITKASPKVKEAIKQQEAILIKLSEGEEEQVRTVPIEGVEVKPSELTLIKETTKIEELTQVQPKEQAKTVTVTATAVTTETAMAEPALPAIAKLPGGASDKDKRKFIKESGGAIAWRMGEIGGKDRWDTIVHPYSSNAHYVMVLGAAPKGATILEKGPGSAYGTAQVIMGKGPTKEVTVDSGFQDILVTPDGKRVKLKFTPDPEGETKGDITIGSPKITERPGRLSDRTNRISRRNTRITPRTPRLR